MLTTRPVQHKVWWQPAMLGLLGTAAVSYTAAVDPNGSHAFPLCPLRFVTGLDCPFCGSLRATHSLAHGHLGAAADHNLLFVLAVPLILVAWGTWLASTIGWPVRRWRVAAPAWWVFAGAAGVFMVLRNMPGDPYAWLASG